MDAWYFLVAILLWETSLQCNLTSKVSLGIWVCVVDSAEHSSGPLVSFILWRNQCQGLWSMSLLDTMASSNLGNESVCLSDTSKRQFITGEIHDRNWSRNYWRILPTSWLLTACSACFLKHSGTSCPVEASPTMHSPLPHQSLIKLKCLLQAILMETIPQLKPPLPRWN